MANVTPFKGIRPAKDKVHLVSSRSMDGYTKADIHDKLKGNPYTFLHVLNPDYDDKQHTAPGSPERLKKIKLKFDEFYKGGVFFRDPDPCFYIYQQKNGENTFTGIIGCSSIEDYFNGVIKIHEQTITEREEKLKQYLEVCDFNAEPVLFSYPNDRTIDAVTEKITATPPEYDFSTTDKIRHMLWPVSDPKITTSILYRFKQIPAIYIADGHHRSASSALLGKSRREKNSSFTGREPFNYYLGVFFPESQLKIYDFNRVVTDLNGLNEKDFLSKLKEKFELVEKGTELYRPISKHNFTMYLDGKWYSLTPKPGIVNDIEPVNSLDASILTEYILSPVLDIHDLKTDKRVGFVPGIKGIEELKIQVDSGKAKAAFGLFPVSMEQLKLIADTNNIMPPKTTWIEPKMRSGLVIYPLW
jgi:uncharacterized protein (DUF1015 family)